MAKKNDMIPEDRNIINVPISEAMPDNYLPYAVEVAKERALPDVRDGLKPVHRRILYGAYKLKAFPDKPYYKSARIVGDILGKYHPHGDSSVYDAMVILAQDFATRSPLIDGHGNWGSVDGDNAAAMRYTEARLTELSMEMLKDIDMDTVNMAWNYSDSELEPSVLPAKFPNLLVNGTFGIAVGLATNIPPHNLGEVIDGTIAYIDNKNITLDELMQHIKGPDLPTGGILIGRNSIKNAYSTGEGKVSLRAKTFIETLDTGRLAIIIEEFPYKRNKAKLLQFISEMTADKRHAKILEPIIDIRDESDRNGVRAVIEFKKSADNDTVERILKYLYKKTELQCNLSFNMVALSDGKPMTLSLKDILSSYINHQRDVITRRTNKELSIAKKRHHIVEGFIKAIDVMDEIIATIRKSKSKSDSEKNIMEKFGFSQEQATAIVELMLYKLSGLEIKAFEKEYKELSAKIKKLERILKDEKELLKVIKKELLEVKDKFADKRRTRIVENDEEAKIQIEEIIIEEDVLITCSNDGFIKRISEKSYKRSNTEIDEIEYREGDYNRFLIESNTKNNIVLFTDKGNMYKLNSINIPEKKWKDKGERIDTLIKSLDLSTEAIIAMFDVDNFDADKGFIFITDKGSMKATKLLEFKTNYSKLVALRLKEEENLIYVNEIQDESNFKYLKVKSTKELSFTVELPRFDYTARNIMGISLFNLPSQDIIKEISFTDEYEYKTFYINLKDNKLKISPKKVRGKTKSIISNTSSRILFFTDIGNVYSTPAFLFQNLKDEGLNVEEILDGYNSDENIVEMISVLNFEMDESIYFISKQGYIKRTLLKELETNSSEIKGYKLKKDDDRIISVILNDNSVEDNMLIITKNAFGINFKLNSVNYMGLNASGVIAISLKDEDEIIFVKKLVLEDTEEFSFNATMKDFITIVTSKGIEYPININDIKEQNRAGRGKKLIQNEMNDFLIKVQ
ncbi:DNA topoisomerase IV subunit A [Clostridium grantii]|uniref:DNA topoisomerase (ATP-hydrolyzing) n=1 Tax=Clostridium grantii DSM 8605 TaxID=1121316 RepID=A0A1M5QPF5_9CLOT|nr:DNA topoisomerase IV subunit A [Clostridium grantii]SHH15761.1 DNA topoisomerase IV subunit A [Clostridium grantii DSM 8605]